jgi:hypothetical protein
MIRNILAGLIVLSLTPYLPAGVIISASGTPTVGLAGYTTYTLTAATNDGSQIQGFDFASLPAYGFFGTMNQLNPAGAATIFADNNAFIPFIPGFDYSQDSQFKFFSSNLTIPAGFASESNTQLRAVFAASAPLGTSVPFVQLAIPNAAAGSVSFVGQIQTVVGSSVTNVDVSGLVPLPEPSIVSLMALLSGGLGLLRRR